MVKEVQRVIIVSLAGLLLGWMIFLFGATISNKNLIIDILYYVITTLLFVSSVLALYKKHQQYKIGILKYMMIIITFFELIITYYIINQHL